MNYSTINQLIEKTSVWDKDERYMATNDLCNILQKDVKLDQQMEQRICGAVIKQLDDASNDVQSVAIKCLAIIIQKVQPAQLGEICNKLCSLILDGNNELRDIYSIGLKTLIADVPADAGTLVTKVLSGRLLTGISAEREDIVRECLDIMTELLKRFGYLNQSYHSEIMELIIVKRINDERAPIRKRAAACLGALSTVAVDDLLHQMMQMLLGRIEVIEKEQKQINTNASSQEVRNLIQTIGTISRTVGHRLGRYLERIIPLLIRFCGPSNASIDDMSQQQIDAINELRETCLPGIESFILRCPREVIAFIPSIIQTATEFMLYDPNYCYDEEPDEDDKMSIAADQDEDNDGDDNYDEEDMGQDENGMDGGDDTSWKVRKAAIKVIAALINSSAKDQLRNVFDTCGDVLLKRFKEREETVRLDVIESFTHLMNGIVNPTNRSLITNESPTDDLNFIKMSQIVQRSLGQFKENSVKTKSKLFNLLSILASSLPMAMVEFVPKLVNEALKCFQDMKNQSLVFDSVSFLRVLMDTQQYRIMQPTIRAVLDSLDQVLKGGSFKLIAETLRLFKSMITVIKPDPSKPDSFDYKTPAIAIYKAILPRLEALDIDQEVKEASIQATAELITSLGDVFPSDALDQLIQTIHNRLLKETTRLASLKALSTITSSSSSLHSPMVVDQSLPEINQYLKHSNRTLRQSALTCMVSIVFYAGKNRFTITMDLLNSICSNISLLLNDTDQHISCLAIRLLISLIDQYSSHMSEGFIIVVFPKLMELTVSSTLQNNTLGALMDLFGLIARVDLPNLTQLQLFQKLYVEIVQSLFVGKVSKDKSKTTSSTPVSLIKFQLANLSKCVARIALPNPTSQINYPNLNKICERIIEDLLPSQEVEEFTHQLALLSIGEIGAKLDISSLQFDSLTANHSIQEILLSYFNSPNEETKQTAAFALGRVAVGNLAAFLPLILEFRGQPNSGTQSKDQEMQTQYLHLVALRETITFYSTELQSLTENALNQNMGNIIPILLKLSEANVDDGVRNIIAECMGGLTAINPLALLSVLLDLGKQDDSFAKRLVANSLRFAIIRTAINTQHRSYGMDSQIQLMNEFLPMFLNDADLEVKKAALMLLNAAVHHQPTIVRSLLKNAAMPVVIQTLATKLERTVDLGPFKHKIDDNLPLRKIALSCVEIVLSTSPDDLEPIELMRVMPMLLADKDDIKLQSHHLLVRLAGVIPSAMINSIELIVEPMEKTLSKKNATTPATGPEVDRANELMKSAIKAIVATSAIDDIFTVSRKWYEFVERLKKGDHTRSLFQTVESEKIPDV